MSNFSVSLGLFHGGHLGIAFLHEMVLVSEKFGDGAAGVAAEAGDVAVPEGDLQLFAWWVEAGF